jgi:hypothetical protein
MVVINILFCKLQDFSTYQKHSDEHLVIMFIRKKKLFTTKQIPNLSMHKTWIMTQSFQNQTIQCLYPRVSVFLVSESANATEKEREEFPLSCLILG